MDEHVINLFFTYYDPVLAEAYACPSLTVATDPYERQNGEISWEVHRWLKHETLIILQLSLRENPLVVRFVRDMTLQPPSLLELAGRTIKLHEIPIRAGEVPFTLMRYLGAAQCCVNPKCKGNTYNLSSFYF